MSIVAFDSSTRILTGTQIEREQLPMFGDSAACELDYLSYEKISEGYGGKGVLISGPEDGIKEKLEEAQRLNRQGHAVLVNALVGKTNFREGSLSV